MISVPPGATGIKTETKSGYNSLFQVLMVSGVIGKLAKSKPSKLINGPHWIWVSVGFTTNTRNSSQKDNSFSSF